MTAHGMVALHEVAHCRAGDKGDDAIIMLAPYEPAHYQALAAAVTESVLRDHFDAHRPGQLTLIELPALGALVMVVRNRLEGGVTRSIGPDPHGKTLSGHLLELWIAWRAETGGQSDSTAVGATSSRPERGSE